MSDIRLELHSTCRLDLPEVQQGIGRWTVAAHLPGSGGTAASPVGELELVVVDLLRAPDPWQVLDASANDALRQVGDVVFEEHTGRLVEDLATRRDGAGAVQRLIVLDRVELEPAWQRRGVAALLAGESLDRLGGGCQLALGLPGPLYRLPNLSGEEYQAGVERMRKVWTQLGFRPFRHDVWVLDLSSSAWEKALHGIRHHHRLP